MLNPVLPVRPAPAVPDRREWLSRCENVTRTDGLVAGLAAVLAGVELSAAPGRVAAIPSASVRPGDVVHPCRIAGLEGISLVAVPGRGSVPAGVGVALAAVRLVVVEQVLEEAVRHLSGRVAGGEPLIRKPMVIGDVAGIRTTVAALVPLVRLAPGPAVLADLHDEITALEWDLAKLFGASGFLVDGPVRVLHVSRLVANCWVPAAPDPMPDALRW